MRTGLAITTFIVCVLLAATSTTFAADFITTMGPGEIFGSVTLDTGAVIEITLISSNASGGLIEFAFTNTSPLSTLDGSYANAAVDQFLFDLPGGYEMTASDMTASQVIAPAGVRFADGAGNPVETYAFNQVLDWEFGLGTGGGLYARAYESNFEPGPDSKNILFSSNALGGGNIPLESYLGGGGFLGSAPDSGVFDTVLFNVTFSNEYGNATPLSVAALQAFYDTAHLTGHFKGGGNGSDFFPDNGGPLFIPEPGTMALLGGGLIALGRIARKRIKSNAQL